MENITDEMREQLRSPLPPEAISQHPTKSFLSSIKAIYVEERLNDVFGVGAWTTRVEHIKDEQSQKSNKNGVFPVMSVVKLIFEIPAYGVYHECYGGNDNDDLGDAYKGATTDALTKIGSYLEIGIDVFKGKSTHSTPNSNIIDRTSKPADSEFTGNKCKDCGADMKISKTSGKEYCIRRCWTNPKPPQYQPNDEPDISGIPFGE